MKRVYFTASRGERAGTGTHLPRLEVVLHAVLEPFALGLQRRDDQTVTHEMRGVADSFAGAEAGQGAGTADRRSQTEVNCVSSGVSKSFM